MNRHALLYTLIITLNAFLVAFEALLVSRQVPLPLAWAWLTPALTAGLTVLTTQLPKLVAAPVEKTPPL
ncbi:MAG TPA: hypothetical protein VGP33_05875 [Chloroflexota bacterium]|jgi:hypothetical protein|nr:hypothetical protein [Chloroflexota bacterium]